MERITEAQRTQREFNTEKGKGESKKAGRQDEYPDRLCFALVPKLRLGT
jgi:hypothetical protein